jgi:hypothetical protein
VADAALVPRSTARRRRPRQTAMNLLDVPLDDLARPSGRSFHRDANETHHNVVRIVGPYPVARRGCDHRAGTAGALMLSRVK